MNVNTMKKDLSFILEHISLFAKMCDERDEGREEGIKQRIEKGREEGAYAKAIETARNCLNLKMPVETIAQVTGLKKEEIDKVITL